MFYKCLKSGQGMQMFETKLPKTVQTWQCHCSLLAKPAPKYHQTPHKKDFAKECPGKWTTRTHCSIFITK